MEYTNDNEIYNPVEPTYYDYKALNKKMLEIFDEYVSKHGKSKVADEVTKIGEEIRNNRTKKASKK